jgi:phosphoribosylanthranilate isomerase
VEGSAGIKDHGKIRQLFEAVRSAQSNEMEV